jgi:alkylation response protein AidB-like acyl-CoA dehydrogenase
MRIALTAEQEQFRSEVRDYYQSVITQDVLVGLRDRTDSGPALKRLVRQMGEDGWLGAGWPKEYGGKGLSPVEKFICFDEGMRAGAPVNTLNTIGPSLMEFGTPEQRDFFLPRLLTGEWQICIGYSEPGAGTDLASLTTKAVRDGDEYVINGQKIWTSVARTADYVWLAARTDPNVPKHKGISLFLFPVDTPGIKIVPINIMGEPDINQVFYEDVRIPVSARIGDENEGWKIITSQLNHERVVLCSSGIVERALSDVLEWASATTLADGRRVVDQDWVQFLLAKVYAKLEFLRLLNWKIAWAETNGVLEPADASATKVFGAELYQEAFELLLEILGQPGYLKHDTPGAVLHGQLEHWYQEHVIVTFAGGTAEVLRDLIAVFGLGMPRAPR